MTQSISPYLAASARRISAQIIPLRAPVYAVTCEHQHRFSRGISDGIALEPTQPVESWGKAFVGGLLIFAVFIPSILFLTGVIGK